MDLVSRLYQRCSPATRILYRYRWLPVTFISALCGAAMAVLTSTLTDEVSSSELTFVRGFVSAVALFIVIIYKGKKTLTTKRADMTFHLANSVFYMAVMFCQIYAYTHMMPADASAILYSYVAMTGLLARIFLKEAFALFELSMVIVTFLGILLIARPPFLFQYLSDDDSAVESKGIAPPLIAFAAAILAAAQAITIRAMGKHDIDIFVMNFYSFVLTAICMAVLTTALQEWSIPGCVWVRARMILMVIFGLSVQGLYCYALFIENAVYVTLVMLNDALFVFLISVIFFGYEPEWMSLLGIFFIIGSSVAITVRKIIVFRRDEKGNQEEMESKEKPVDFPDLLEA